jgi:hypothetical protein
MAAQDWNKPGLSYEVPAYRSDEADGSVVHMVNDSHGRIKNGDWDGSAAMCGHLAPDENSGHVWKPSYGFANCPLCLRAYVGAGGKGWYLPLANMDQRREEQIDEMLKKLRGAHFTNLLIRKDGQDLNEEGDWIKNLRKL